MSDIKIDLDFSQFEKGLRELELFVHQAQVKSARDISKRWGDKARDYAPIDEGALSSEIVGEIEESKNQIAIICKVPSNATSKDYAIKMHEDSYKLGAKSQNKNIQQGGKVGNKFITRSRRDNLERFKKIVTANLERILR